MPHKTRPPGSGPLVTVMNAAGVRRGLSRRESGARHVPCPERRDAQEIVVVGAAGSDPGSEPRVFRAGDG